MAHTWRWHWWLDINTNTVATNVWLLSGFPTCESGSLVVLQLRCKLVTAAPSAVRPRPTCLHDGWVGGHHGVQAQLLETTQTGGAATLLASLQVLATAVADLEASALQGAQRAQHNRPSRAGPPRVSSKHGRRALWSAPAHGTAVTKSQQPE